MNGGYKGLIQKRALFAASKMLSNLLPPKILENMETL
jgi:hypothetical protein